MRYTGNSPRQYDTKTTYATEDDLFNQQEGENSRCKKILQDEAL